MSMDDERAGGGGEARAYGLGRLARQALRAAVAGARAATARALDEHLDADRVLRRSTNALVELAAARYPVDPGAEWAPGRPLDLLLVGYAGARNTGADARVEEMIRQFRHLLGDEHLRLSVLTLDAKRTRGYFAGARQIAAPRLFPKFLFDVVHAHHGVVACEGAMFGSKHASALTTYVAGALGMAGAEQKLAIGYGGEVGAMEPEVEAMVRRHASRALILARDQASVDALKALDIQAALGTDTAWTFAPHPPPVGEAALFAAGWDGRRPVIACCPVNPFWWPVRADWRRGLEQALSGAHARDHHASIYFHAGGDEVDASQAAYLAALAGALEDARAAHGAFVVLVGMEAIDRRAVEGVAELMAARPGGAPPAFVADEHDHRTVVSVLRVADALVASRYHALVTTMPAGIPAVGVTLDARITDLLGDAGLADLSLAVGDPELRARIGTALARILSAERSTVRVALERAVARHLRLLGAMGRSFVEAVKRRHPAFPVRDGLGAGGDPLAHLPPLSPALEAILAAHPPEAVARLA